MRKFFFSTSGVQTVPAVNGGATESLLTYLIEENEKFGFLDIVVLSIFDKEAYKISKKYKKTKIIYHKSFSQMSLIDIVCNLGLLKYFLYLITMVFTGHKKKVIPRYYYNSFHLAKKEKVEYVVAEGGIYEYYKSFKKYFAPDAMYAHLHREVHGNENLWTLFPQAIAVSSYISRKYLEGSPVGKVKCFTLDNCYDDNIFVPSVDLDEKKQLISRLGFNEDDFIVSFSGRLVPEKGVLELIDAVLGLDEQRIKLMVIGSSFFNNGVKTDYVELVEGKAKASNGRIVTTGFVHNSKLPLYFSISSLCVVPSIYEEPRALVPAEAMASGVPVIISDSGGMTEYEQDDCLLVARRGEQFIENLQSLILEVYRSRDLQNRLSQKGMVRAKEYTRQNYYRDFCKIFEISTSVNSID